MTTLLIRAKSKSNLKLLADLARKLGEKVTEVSESDFERFADDLFMKEIKSAEKDPVLSASVSKKQFSTLRTKLQK